MNFQLTIYPSFTSMDGQQRFQVSVYNAGDNGQGTISQKTFDTRFDAVQFARKEFDKLQNKEGTK